MNAGFLSGLYLVFAALAFYGSWRRREDAGLRFWALLILSNIWLAAWGLA